MTERWAPIAGFGGKYEISSTGLVRSIAVDAIRKDGRRFNYRPRILPVKVTNGYPTVLLAWDGQKKRAYIHRLLAEAFIPNPGELPIVRHLNDDKQDYRLANLAWGTQLDNMQDAIRNRRLPAHSRTECIWGHPLTRAGNRRKCYVCHAKPVACDACGAVVSRHNAARHRKTHEKD